MIILFKEGETNFDNLGIGVLKDATKCLVGETLNDTFELELEYPVFGQNYSEIKIDSIIYSKSSPKSKYQPFRVYSISKPLKGLVTIKALHISYDMNGIVIGPISEGNLQSTLSKLESESLLPHNFKFYSKVQSTKTYSTSSYYNLRALLFGSDSSILESYKLEVKFDGFNVYLLDRRGSDKNAQIRYGKNMTELEHEFTHDLLYNYVYPYYHKESTSQSTTTNPGEFKQAYIVGNKPLQDGWLSYEENGEPYHPMDEAPIQIATDGDFYKKVFTWDTTKQKYRERLYEQQVTLIEGVTAPEWIEIDWSGLPSIIVRARQAGYFKSMMDTEYKYANIGDIVFTGSIRTISQNLILYYSEVIPPTEAELNDVETSVTHVELPNKLLKVDTELANKMTFNRVLNLDLTDEFKDDEEANEETLTSKALKFIKENKIGQYKYNTTVSFIDLSKIDDNVVYKNLEQVELGDTIKIIYEALDINVELRVISTVYDAILDRYSSIELGEKSDTISSSSVQTGDSISSLVNDKGYADEKTVSSIIAKTVTADYIQATNAKLSKAQIEELETARIKVTGMLEASQAEIDQLVAKMLIADNAKIKETLEAGQIKVSGDITVKSGEISIQNDDGSSVFQVDRNGNLYANSATIKGRIEASEGYIGGFHINQTSIWNNIDSMNSDNDNGVYIGPDGISLGKQLKIYPNGLIISHTYTDQSTMSQLLIPSQIKPKVRLNKNRSTEAFGGMLLGSMSLTQITNYYSSVQDNLETIYVANVSETGIITNGDGTTLPVLKGDNVASSKTENDDKLNWRKIDSDEFDKIYNYVDDGSALTLNARTQNNTFNSGDICKILEDEKILNAKEYDPDNVYMLDVVCIYNNNYYKCLQDNVTGSWDSSKWSQVHPSTYHKLYDSEGNILNVNVGDYVIFIKTKYYGMTFNVYDPNKVYNKGDIVKTTDSIGPFGRYAKCLQDNVTGTWNPTKWLLLAPSAYPIQWKWTKYYITNAYDPKYFGLTPEGILYANGAIISGDVTVKSGEISIESDDGSKVFRVDREGNLYANSATIKGRIEADEGEIAGFSISRQEHAGDKIYGIYYESTIYDDNFGKIFMQIGLNEYGTSNPYPFIKMESVDNKVWVSALPRTQGLVYITSNYGVSSSNLNLTLANQVMPDYYREGTHYHASSVTEYEHYCKHYDEDSGKWKYYECISDTTGPWDATKWQMLPDTYFSDIWDRRGWEYYDALANLAISTRVGSMYPEWYQKPNFIINFEHIMTSSSDIINLWEWDHHLYNIIGVQITIKGNAVRPAPTYELISTEYANYIYRKLKLNGTANDVYYVTVYCKVLPYNIEETCYYD